MNDAQALQVMKEFLDQAIGQGLFKNSEMVMTAAAALERLRAAVKERDDLLLQLAIKPPAEVAKKKK